MPTLDFGKQFHHRTATPFTSISIGLAVEGIWNDESGYKKPLLAGTVFELLLLYTVDRRAQQRPPPNNVLTEEDKRRRYALAQKLRDCKKASLETDEVELLRLVISVLGVEPNAICHAFLDEPEI